MNSGQAHSKVLRFVTKLVGSKLLELNKI